MSKKGYRSLDIEDPTDPRYIPRGVDEDKASQVYRFLNSRTVSRVYSFLKQATYWDDKTDATLGREATDFRTRGIWAILEGEAETPLDIENETFRQIWNYLSLSGQNPVVFDGARLDLPLEKYDGFVDGPIEGREVKLTVKDLLE